MNAAAETIEIAELEPRNDAPRADGEKNRRETAEQANAAGSAEDTQAVAADETALESPLVDDGGIQIAVLPVPEAAAVATVVAAAIAPEAGLEPAAGGEDGGILSEALDAGGSIEAADPLENFDFGNLFGANPRGPFEGLPKPTLEVPEREEYFIEEDEAPEPEPEQPTPPTTIDYNPDPETPPGVPPCDPPQDPDDPLNPDDVLAGEDDLQIPGLDQPQESPDEPGEPPVPTDGPGPDGPMPCPGPIEPQLGIDQFVADDLSVAA